MCSVGLRVEAKERAREESKSNALKPNKSLLRWVLSLLCDRNIMVIMVAEDIIEIVEVTIWAIE
jgi:hypothetical protein